MNRKLTLTLDEDIINFGKLFAKEKGTSLSQLLSSYLKSLKKTEADLKLLPQVQELYGALDNLELPDKKEMRRHFHEKNYS